MDLDDPLGVTDSPYRLTLINGLGPYPSIDLLGPAIERLAHYFESDGWEIGQRIFQADSGAVSAGPLPMIAAGNPRDGFSVHIEGVVQEPERNVQTFGFVFFCELAVLHSPSCCGVETDLT
jgi:hypothetical protein